uniref:Uncharacterized protein n=1 Tax=Magallana gigas TaxID=29159 RepID=K1PFF8_MAGGI
MVDMALHRNLSIHVYTATSLDMGKHILDDHIFRDKAMGNHSEDISSYMALYKDHKLQSSLFHSGYGHKILRISFCKFYSFRKGHHHIHDHKAYLSCKIQYTCRDNLFGNNCHIFHYIYVRRRAWHHSVQCKLLSIYQNHNVKE